MRKYFYAANNSFKVLDLWRLISQQAVSFKRRKHLSLLHFTVFEYCKQHLIFQKKMTMNHSHNEEEEQEKFSEDPEEQLNIENDILKLKLKAEHGGNFEMEGELPPEIENAFLKNVIEFEHQFANATSQKLHDVMGNPVFAPAAELSDEEIEVALEKAEDMLGQYEIEVDYRSDYPARLKYQFITEELILKETHFFHVPGMTMHFIYEEFHPNYQMDLEDCAHKFYDNWMEQSIGEFSYQVIYSLRKDAAVKLPSEEIAARFKNIFDSFHSFDNGSFTIDNMAFDVKEEKEKKTGNATVQGHVSYEATLENGELQHFEADYEMLLVYEECWCIQTLRWPGFVW